MALRLDHLDHVDDRRHMFFPGDARCLVVDVYQGRIIPAGDRVNVIPVPPLRIPLETFKQL